MNYIYEYYLRIYYLIYRKCCKKELKLELDEDRLYTLNEVLEILNKNLKLD